MAKPFWGLSGFYLEALPSQGLAHVLLPPQGPGALENPLPPVALLSHHLPVSVVENPKAREALAFALLGHLNALGEVNVLGRAKGGRDLRAGQVVHPG